MPVAGAISGLTDKVPRLDRWVQALELVRTYGSFAQFEGQVAAGSVGSALAPGGDSSSPVARQLIRAMAEVLRQIDRRMLSRVVQSSISIDKTADMMLLYVRLLVPEGIYDFLGSVRGDTLSDVEAIGSALEAALQQMCTSATGEFDQDELHRKFLDSVTSAVADGGPTEQRVLYNVSPARPGGFSNGEEPLFKNLALIARDRPHRFRSVQKGFWSHVGLEIKEFLDALVVGPRSLARLMETSRKFSLLFEAKQRESKARNVHDAPAFAGVLRNLQFSESRFSSRTKPLFRLFRLLPEVIQTLAEISSWKAQAEKDEADWATALLEKWGGDKGYEALVSAAVVADSLIASQPALRVEDEASADYALSGPAAAELKMSLEALLLHGGIFLPEAEGSLTHHCLRAIQSKTIFVKSGTPGASAVSLRWMYGIYLAFFNANFPMYEATSFACFNLDAEMSTSDRFRFLRMLCLRFDLSIDACWRQFIGNGHDSGLLHRARWHSSAAGVAYAASQESETTAASAGNRLFCHPPESKHQRSWLKTWQEVRGNSPGKQLIAHYLSALSGTGTVDRWLGQCRRLDKFRSLPATEIENAAKLLVQDAGGRRRVPLDPRAVLIKAAPAATAGGGSVCHPISAFGLKAQKVYASLYGERRLPSRDLLPHTPGEIARQRLLAERPRLSAGRKKSGNSEADLLNEHRKIVGACVERVQKGNAEADEAAGPLGEIPLPAPKRQRLMAEASSAVNNMYSAIVTGMTDAQGQVVADSAETEKAIRLQRKIADCKADAFLKSSRRVPVAYVDAKAGLMRPAVADSEMVGPAPELPARPRVMVDTSVTGLVLDQAAFSVRRSVDFSKDAHVIVVADFHQCFYDPVALYARLRGRTLVEPGWFSGRGQGLAFRSFMQARHVILYIHESFQSAHPTYVDCLHKCSRDSPALKSGKPHFELQIGSKPEVVRTPTLTYELVDDKSKSKEAKVAAKQWTLQELLHQCTLVWDQPSSSSSSGQ
ncbi:unnamed protein product [Symbiodinium sp. CCMP2592]|nr:unnamed protein product [Symbiodinium sp. CCMP2592]